MRARQSAEILAAGIGGIEIIEEPAIAEVLYGRWEGMHYHELIDDPHYITYRKSPIEHPTPGGETIPEVQARGVEAVMRAIAAHPGQRVIFVSHGDIIRTVLCHFLRSSWSTSIASAWTTPRCPRFRFPANSPRSSFSI